MPHYLSAQEACQRLGIKEATLYAYVSRGLIRSEVESQSTRKRRYLAEDVDKLVDRKEQRRDPAKVVEDALHWGVPLLDSAITLIADNQLYFRGYNASDLAQTQSVESVAALIWLDDATLAADLFTQAIPLMDSNVFTNLNLAPVPAIQIALALASTVDFAAYDLSPMGVARTGARILKLMTATLTQFTPSQASIAETLAAAWSLDSAALLNAALILCADHELNASSFTARVTASTEANPYAVVQAGLAALQGFKHGGHTARVSAFMREVGAVERIHQAIGERLQRGDNLFGFGHLLYPEGDPRAKTLMSLIEQTHVASPDFILAQAVIEAVHQVTGHLPTIDFALAALERTLALPNGSALSIFALGRTIGWMGHAIEQYGSSHIIRPRARYTGRPPAVNSEYNDLKHQQSKELE